MIVIGEPTGSKRQILAVGRRLGLRVVFCATGEAGLERCRRVPQVMAVIATPEIDARVLDLVGRLRRLDVPAIVVFGDRIDPAQRAAAFKLGAKDVIAKPRTDVELEGRLRQVLDQTTTPNAEASLTSRVMFAGFILDRAERSLRAPDGQPIALTGMVYDLLDLFVRHPNRTLARDWILRMLRQRASLSEGRALEMAVSRLRAALRLHLDGGALIKTVRGEGYVLAARVHEADRVAAPT